MNNSERLGRIEMALISIPLHYENEIKIEKMKQEIMKAKQPTKTPEQKELLRITSDGKVYLEGALVSEEDVKKAWGWILNDKNNDN
jgi:hypothetical protein